MNRQNQSAKGAAVLAAVWALMVAPLQAEVRLEGEVSLDYYVSYVDAEGFESTEVDFYAERVVNDSSRSTAPMSLWAWLTPHSSAAGSGTDIADLPIGALPGASETEVWDWAIADDAAPGEYYTHVLLQDDRYPEQFEDARSLSPRLLWRGGLEAIGPLDVYRDGAWLSVYFDALHNNRLDGRYSNDIRLTLYATYGFGPASEGYTLCSKRISGLYAGDYRSAPSFECLPADVPNGAYTIHLSVAEIGGRGGESTLSGSDATFYGGWMESYAGLWDYRSHGSHHHAGALKGSSLLWMLLAMVLGRRRRAAVAGLVPIP